MEQKLVRVPFDIELAKKITNKEIEGNIVTADGHNARIICWNLRNMGYNIIGAIDFGEEERGVCYNEKGKTYDFDNAFTLFLEIPEYLTFKDGDIIACGWEGQNEGSAWVSIVKSIRVLKNDIHTSDYVFLMLKSNNNTAGKLVFEVYTTSVEWIRKATESEKQKLIDALKASKVPRAKEYLKRFFGIEEKPKCEFKPFDKVLVRDNNSEEWKIDFFGRMIVDKEDNLPYKYEGVCGATWNYCIPYNEQTKHLLGTTDNWEEQYDRARIR